MKTASRTRSHPASFRDRDGFLFERQGRLLRQVNRSYLEDYEQLMRSGFYDRLVASGDLIPHREVDEPGLLPELAYKILEPARLEFVSYPYEWCFSQLKDAALLTLQSQKRAVEAGLSLKDASAYNVQFRGARPLLIDSLSFARYQPGQPWIAYRQFCQHFLAPLALMSYRDVRLGQLLRVYLDGIPLDLASRLLPWRTRLRGGLQIHLHLHASMQRRSGDTRALREPRRISRHGMLGLVDSLERTVRRLKWDPGGTDWADYANFHSYSAVGLEQKRHSVEQFLDSVRPGTLWDLGANTGFYSRLAGERQIFTVAFDVDPGAVELNYRQCRTNSDSHVLPLLLDLTNPSPSQGWAHHERQSLSERGPADAVLGLALVHHLAIGNNLPLGALAEFLESLAPKLLLEFVPKSDPQVERMLANRVDIFPDYSVHGFEQAFGSRYAIRRQSPIADSDRVLYWLERRE